MVPSEIRADFDMDFSVSGRSGDVPEGYQAQFLLGGTSSLKKAGTIDGDDIAFSLLAGDTENLATGQYDWQVVAEEIPESSSSSGQVLGRRFIDEGTVWVIRKLTGEGADDRRSVAEKILAAIDASIQGKATADQQSYVIQSGSGSRSLSRVTMEDLLRARALYANIVAQEKRAKGDQPLFKRHTFEFVKP